MESERVLTENWNGPFTYLRIALALIDLCLCVFQIQFEALPSRSIFSSMPDSDMAIDDITFINCAPNAVDNTTSMFKQPGAVVFYENFIKSIDGYFIFKPGRP